MAIEPTRRRTFGRGFWTRFAIALLAVLLGPGCATRSTGPPASEEATTREVESEQTAGAVQPEIKYQVVIEGVDQPELRDLLNQVSETVRLVDRPPPSLIRLRRRAEDDRPRLEQALRSRGYYGAEVTTAIEPDAKPVRVVFTVKPGPVYRFRDVTIEVTPPALRSDLPSLEELGIAPGRPAASQPILDAEAALLARARAKGHALAKLGERRAVVDHDTQTMDLTLVLQAGPVVRFGAIQLNGLTSVRADAVRRRLPWQTGEVITDENLAEGRTALFDSGLFSSVVINLGTTPDQSGEVPVTVALIESKHRSIALGLRYRTDEGPGGNISWEDRNVFHRGELAKLELDASGIGGSLTGSFRKPDFWKRDQALVTQSELAYQNTDAFTSRSASARVGLERILAKGMTATGSVAFRASRVKDQDGDEDTFGLVSLPAQFKWDRSDDLLNPTRGGRLTVDNEPFTDTFGKDLTFNKSKLAYTHYLKVLETPEVILAGRGAVGTLFGASRSAVPADLRFYAGGGGSVRGFGFQLAGKLDRDHNPLGGRSLLELSGEVRLRLTETIGAVAFVDAGSDFTSQVPDLDPGLRIGAGPGLRYFSPIGPLRLDVGFPLNPRPSDDAFQLYVSLGQAF
jgi:translocation and assembly module TamA